MEPTIFPKLMPTIFKKIFFICLFFAIFVFGLFAVSPKAFAASLYWVGGDGGNTNDKTNWSTSDPAVCNPGGGNASAAPTTTDVAIFDPDCDNGAAINANWSVAGININAGYTGTITQNASITLTVGSSNYIQADGTFTGGNSTIDINGTFALSDGTFTSTSGTLSVSSTFTISGTPVFTHNSGKVQFDTSAATITPSTATFSSVSFTSAVAKTIADSNTLTVAGTLTLTDGSIAQTTIPAAGSISAQGASITQASTFDGGSGLIVINGTIDQTFTGSATTTVGGLPNIEISKTLGTLYLAGTIRTERNWTYTQGTLDATTNDSTVVFYTPYQATRTITGSHTLDNVNIYSYAYTSLNGTIIADNNTITVAGTLTLTDGSIAQTTIPAAGSISAQGASITQASTFDGGSGLIVINGTIDQTFTGSATTTLGGIPNIEISKTLGTLYLAGTIRTTKNWTYTQGTLDATTNDSTVVFATTLTITGSHTLDNVIIDSNDSSARTFTIASGTTLTTAGTLTIDNSSTGTITINTGIISAQGNVTVGAGPTAYNGTATLTFSGSNTQTFDLTGATALLDLDTKVNKSGGQVNLASTLTMNATNQDLIIEEGTFDIVANTLSVSGTGFTFVVQDGGNFQLQGSETTTTPTLQSGSTVTYDATSASHNIQDFGYHHLTLNGSGGTFVFTGTETCAGNLTITNGTVDFNGQQINVTGNLTMATGSQVIVGVDAMNGADLNVTGALDLDGELGDKLTFNWTTAWSLDVGGNADMDYVSFATGATNAQTLVVSGATATASYVDVEYSNATGGTEINATDGTNTNNANNTNWNFGGTLTVDIVNASYVSVGSPTMAMNSATFSFSCQTVTGSFGTASQQIYVNNNNGANNGWTLTLAAQATTNIWDSAGTDYDFNDPTGSGCTDGVDAGDTVGGQMTVDPSVATLAVGQCGSCSTANISKGSSAAFNEGTINTITLLTATAASDNVGDWTLQGVSISQTIPAEQPAASDYNINIVLTVTAS